MHIAKYRCTTRNERNVSSHVPTDTTMLLLQGRGRTSIAASPPPAAGRATLRTAPQAETHTPEPRVTPTARIQTTASTVALHHAASRTFASRVGTHHNTLGYVLGVSRSGPKKDATAQPGSLVCTISNHFNANSPSTVVGTPASTCQKSCTCPRSHNW